MAELPSQPVSDGLQPQRGGARKGVWRRAFLDLLETVLLAAVLFLGIHAITARIRVESVSMVPTLQPGNFVIINRLGYRFGTPQRGDILVFRLPQDPSQRFIKRAIGLPGETVQITGGQVFIDGRALSEDYVNRPTGRGGTWQIPENSIFVLGDNRNNSSDSRSWGVVTFDNLIGKALFVYWPPNQWTSLGGTAYAAGDS